MKLNRFRIEMFCTFLAIVILGGMTVFIIFFIADEMFTWNIFPPEIENVIVFIIGALGAVLVSCVLVSIMVNFSIIAIAFASIERKLPSKIELKGGNSDD